jgi:hypothetical protein
MRQAELSAATSLFATQGFDVRKAPAISNIAGHRRAVIDCFMIQFSQVGQKQNFAFLVNSLQRGDIKKNTFTNSRLVSNLRERGGIHDKLIP